MTQPEVDERVQRWADEAWPLRFNSHSFGARHYNTLRCRIIYDNYSFTRLTGDEPKGGPYSPDWKDDWSGGYTPYRSDLLTPVEIAWTSLDGSEHATTVDLDAIFKGSLVLHDVKREDVPVGWLAAWGKDPLPVHILLEVNDRAVNVYFKAHVTTIDEQEPGNPRSHHRKDLILAWTHTY